MFRYETSYRLKRGADLGDVENVWNPRWQDVDVRLNSAESQFKKFDDAALSIINTGIRRIDETLQPAINLASGRVVTLNAQVTALQNQIISDSNNLTSQLNALLATANALVAGLSATSVFDSGTFATPLIKLISLHSSVPGAAPALGDMDHGRMAINTADRVLFWKSADGLSVESFNFRTPALTSPTVTTQVGGDSSTKAASTAFVTSAISGILATVLGGSPPPALNTFAEVAAAINNDPAFYTNLNNFLINLVRFDAAQTLSPTQLAQVQANIGLGSGSYAYHPMTDAAQIVVDFSQGFNQSVTIAGNRNFGPPQNIVVGTSGMLKVTQDGAGAHTLGFVNGTGGGATGWSFDSDVAPIIGTAAGKESYLAWHAKTPSKILVGLSSANVTP